MRMPNRLVPLPLPYLYYTWQRWMTILWSVHVSVRNWKNIRERASSRQSYCLLKMPYFASHVTMAIIFIEPDQILRY